MTLRLYTFWRSQASFRVRIALRLKGLRAEMAVVDLMKGEQFAPTYQALHPGMVLPALIDGEGPAIIQSLAILEYLEEKYPKPALLPQDVRARAFVRALAQVLAVDAHPLIVPRVRNYLEKRLGIAESARNEWLKHWMEEGLRMAERLLAQRHSSDRFCHGSAPTIADVCLVPHIASAEMLYELDLSLYPHTRRVYDACMQMDAFALAHPSRQDEAPAAKN